MTTPHLGLKANWKQFSLLVIVNAFVGGMVGLERSIVPKLAESEFHLEANTAILSFIIVFGITKALGNYFAGTFANKIGRKNLLVIGWIFAIPIPFILIYANNWNWIIFANVLLGINQGLTWSSTVVMKIDLVGEKKRGFAMGLNEFSGYIAVAGIAFLSAYIANNCGLRPFPFYIGIVLVFLGLFSSIFLIKDTRNHSKTEETISVIPKLKNVFLDTSWRHKKLSSVTQAGLINNLNDGMVWGIFPMILTQKNFDLQQMGIIISVYPAVWGLSQIFTGHLADKYSKKSLLFLGMFVQSMALFYLIFASSMLEYVLLSIVLGLGTALVYPTFLVTIAENTHPIDRAKSIGVFRLWRDLGYAIGAILTGMISDIFNLNAAILFIAFVTLVSAFIILVRFKNK